MEDTTNILEEHEKNNLFNLIKQDDNRININYVLKQIVIIKGKNLILSEKYDEAIELYEKNEMKKEQGLVYLEYKKDNSDYRKAFEIFHSIDDYYYALKSLKKLKNIPDIINYCNLNEVASYLGIIEYNDIYINYTNDYFKPYFIARKKIFENELFEMINKSDKENLSYNNIIKEYFSIYLNQINKFQKKGIINENNLRDKINTIIEQNFGKLNLDSDTKNFINAYY